MISDSERIGDLLAFIDELTPKIVFMIFTDHMKKQYVSRRRKNKPLVKRNLPCLVSSEGIIITW